MVVHQLTSPSSGLPDVAAGSLRLDAPAMATVVRCLGPAAATAGSGGSGAAGGAVPAMAATVVACCCRREEERSLAIACGAPSGLLALLAESERADAQVAALEGLSLLLPAHPPACEAALARPAVTQRLTAALRDPSPATRLLAAGCIAALSRHPSCGAEQSEAMQRSALPVLLRLLANPATRPAVPAVLAALIEGSERLQKAAADADTVRLLAGLLAAEASGGAAPAVTAAGAAAVGCLASAAPAATVGPSTAAGTAATAPGLGSPGSGAGSASSCSAALREGCLRALGSLCLNRDDSRRQLLEAKVLRHIVRCLEDPCEGVRAAAALVVRALSRCVRTLRGGLLEGGRGELAPVLVKLLGDANADVRASAAAAVCNLVLDFSAAKAAVLAAGGLPALVALTAQGQPPGLRHHAAWALGNMLYRADAGVRAAVMQALPWSSLAKLAADTETGVAEQALVCLRNLALGDAAAAAATVAWVGGSHAPLAAGGSCGGGSGPVGASAAGPLADAAEAEAHEALLGLLQERIEGAAAAVAAELASRPAVAGAEGVEPMEGVESEDSEGAAGRAAGASPSAGDSRGLEHSGGSAAACSPAAPAPASASRSAAAVHALYAVANLLTGGPRLKAAVAGRRPLLGAMTALLRAGGGAEGAAAVGELALPTVWCIINLTWPAPSSAPSAATGGEAVLAGRAEQEALRARCRALSELGAEAALEGLAEEHPQRDVRERARTALEQLRRGADSC
ncbi:hypothetical protein HYH03_015759 [Edaphochlamys debaryana]|uniref:Armadillo repeat-containing protein 8 n=1 Tax=Edaphochlamys debaryana TaxID=47281 RepID=A0A836BQU0_9CHLO|nr:hypothetical protein HYH03_015759 [Edaphochlamys debaryana]|eukprot:KAG2485485.1 hypothetical protein HYH03_015759 [Edaphochlamys debaryana]